MSSGLGAKLPLTIDSVFGPYNLLTDYNSLAQQNLKMLILTNPGERMMDTSFGVGLLGYLFENNGPATYAEIQGRIISQCALYLPYIKIERVEFSTPEGLPDFYPHQIVVRVYFQVVPMQLSSVLEIEVNNNAN
jgi:hypothetical protein